LSQNERSHALQAMRDGRAKVCIATDVAARGIDLPNLELVVHADLPTNPETLLHRSGRTGRAGRKGVSALIIPHHARRRTERLLQNAGIKPEWASPPSADEVIRRDNERLLEDPAFTQPIRDEERGLIAGLLERHGAEQVAAALLRLSRAGRSAPEYLSEPAPFKPSAQKGERSHRDEQPNHRDDFGDSVWFSLSVGRRQNAEPRWLIPMLCRTGGITKREIGAIQMQPEESFVQIAEGSADRFFAAIGPDHKVQGNISVRRLEGQPDLSRAGYNPPKPDKKPHRGKGKFEKAGFDKAAPSRGFEKRGKPGFATEQPRAAKPGKTPFEKFGAPKTKKPKKRPE
jgi:ATP-dependent RNA helicase DeaD